MVLRLYWVGQYEEPGRHRKKWDWFFEHDLAPTFRKYLFAGGEHAHTLLPVVLVLMGMNKGAIVWLLAFLCKMLARHPFISLLLLCVCFVLARYLPDWGAAIVSIGLALPVVIISIGLVVRAT